MATPKAGENEWSDPYPILGEYPEPAPKAQLITEIQQELVSSYEQTHTITPLDSRTGFRIQQLDQQATDTYSFRAKRFVGRRPAGTYTGTAVETDSGWHVTFDDDAHFIQRLVHWFKSDPSLRLLERLRG